MSGDKKVGAALVVGGGVGGMQAALDLAEAGIKTYILDEKTSIGGAMVQLDKTFPTNDCAMCTIAPRLVGIGRHLNIEVITNAEIEEVRGSPGNFAVKVKQKARYIDLSKCTGCAACVEKCPIELDNDFDQGLIKRNAIYRRYPQAVPSAFAIDKDGRSPCRIACPAGVNPHAYIALLRTGRTREAYELIKSALPFPGICGRVCHHPCEKECYRGKLLDEPVAICALKRYIADAASEEWEVKKPPVSDRKETVAVVGAGPAGLTCARDLASLGYKVTVFDSQPHAGGMMRRVIPRYRLSTDLVDKEVGEIFTDGIEFRLNTTVGKDISFAELRRGFDSIFIAVGAGLCRTLPRLPGIELHGVMLALPFLEDINRGERPRIGEKVMVIGGGNVAMDVARSALRIGAKEANVVCLESWEEMLCHPWEREEAVEEGVKIHNSLGPERLIGENGRVKQAEFLRVESIFDDQGRFNPTYLPGTESIFDCDTVIIAIGQASELGFLDGSLELAPGGWIKVDPVTLETMVPGIFAGGDAVKGPASIVEAAGAGHNAAISIDRFLLAKDIKEGREPEVVLAPEPKTEGLARSNRAPTRRLDPERRRANFEEVVLPLTEEEVLVEAERCIACAKCCECRECEKACEAKAINHEVEREEVTELNVGAIIVAPGFELFDASMKKELGYGRFPNVITSLQFERILSASGPFSGEIVRPSDKKKPQRIAFIQCVGSREIDANYCSAVCCMYATKEAIIVKEHHPEIDIKIFYIDLRAYGKGFEAYYERAKSLGVEYIRCRPSEIKEVPDTRQLKIRYCNGQGEVAAECFDMVVLSCGLGPSAKAEALAQKLGLKLNPWGFYETEPFKPAETSREGIFACGLFTEPKDIPETVTQGSAAAAKVLSFLSTQKGQLIKSKTYPQEKDVSGQEPRIGVFICHCGKNIAGVVDVPQVVEYVKTLPNVVYVESNLYTCSTDTGEEIKQKIEEQDLNRLIVASCTPRTHEPLFQDTLREAGLNPYLFEMANIRDQCSWVHMHEPEVATEKAKDLIRMAVAKARLLEPLYPQFVDVIPRALVIGGGMAGMTAALDLAEQGFETYLLEKGPVLGGNARRLKLLLNSDDPQEWLDTLIEKVTRHPKIQVYTETEISDFQGSIGNFKTEFTANGKLHTIEHGVAIVATGAREYRPQEYMYGQDPRVMTQLELEEKVTNGDFKASSVVMIQCVGSREKPRAYCSRVCCSQAVKNALKIKERNQEANVFILNRDVRTYGFSEGYYRRAREAGVRFIRFEEGHKPEVASVNGHLVVSVDDSLLDMKLDIECDAVILSAGTAPRDDNSDLAQKLKIPLTQDGFFLEAHMKLRPVDFATDGIFLCGLAHGPKSLSESIAQASAAAARASTVLSKRQIELEPKISQVVDENCDGCAYCIEPCPFDAITLIEYMKDGALKKTVESDPTKCRGCGVCQATCPKKGIFVRNFRLEQISAMVEAALAK